MKICDVQVIDKDRDYETMSRLVMSPMLYWFCYGEIRFMLNQNSYLNISPYFKLIILFY
jgi:hypothetical protein